MKNLIKPLEWQCHSDVHCASITGSFIEYKAYSTPACYYAKILSGPNAQYSYVGLDHETLEEAKAACEAHYAKIILDGLSPEARAILEQHLNPQTPTV